MFGKACAIARCHALRSFGSVSLRKNREAVGVQIHQCASQSASDAIRKNEGLVPENKKLTDIIRRASDRRDWETVKSALDEARHMDTILYNASMAAAVKCGKYDSGLELFDKMGKEGCAKTMASYTPVIRILGIRKRYEDAQRLWNEMTAGGIHPNSEEIAFVSIISAAAEVGNVSHALYYLGHLKQRGFVKPRLHVFNAALNACKNAADWSAALEILDDIRSQELVPDVISYSAAIAAHHAAPLPQIIALEAQMSSDGVQADAGFIEQNLLTLGGIAPSAVRDLDCLQQLDSERASAMARVLGKARSQGIRLTKLAQRAEVSLQRLGHTV